MLGLWTQESSEAGRDLTPKHEIFNCYGIAHTIGPHLYVQVKEQFGLMHWHRSFPFTSSWASHLTSSAEGGQAERVIYWTHLFISDLFSAQFIAHLFVEVPSLLQRPREKLQKWTILTPVSQPARVIWWVELDHLWWRLQMHSSLMAVEATNCTHLHPYLGKPTVWSCLRAVCLTPSRQVCFWQLPLKYCQASFSSSRLFKGSQKDRVADPESTKPVASFDFPARFTWFGLWSHLYMHTHIFSSMKPEYVPSDTTSKTTAD